MKISDVTIAGAGTLGSQIAWQTAFNGFKVTVYDAFEKGLEVGKVCQDEQGDSDNRQIGEKRGQRHPDTAPEAVLQGFRDNQAQKGAGGKACRKTEHDAGGEKT